MTARRHSGEERGTAVLPYSSDDLAGTFGYHPDVDDLEALLAAAPFADVVVVQGSVPESALGAERVAHLRPDAPTLPVGLYWFRGIDRPGALLVGDGTAMAPPRCTPVAELDEDGDLARAYGWYRSWLDEAAVVPDPRFGAHDDVLVRSTRTETVVRRRQFYSGSWHYQVRTSGRTQWMSEAALAPVELDDDPVEWVGRAPEPARRMAATLTRAKLADGMSNTVFSFRASRTLFRPYQFRPVLKLLQTGRTRLLVADEVGLGKTIEAGLLWTELEARGMADRVLVVCPSNLVAKWRSEMSERFGFALEELTAPALRELRERTLEGRLPTRCAYVGSLERLRVWDSVEELSEAGLGFDLVVVDEAHAMRNEGTRNHALGTALSEWASALVFLTATPVNLRSADLFTLLDLLVPGDYGSAEELDEALAPNSVLRDVGRLLGDGDATPAQRLGALDGLQCSARGILLQRRAVARQLRAILSRERLAPPDVVEARRCLAELNPVADVMTRTRKVEVQEEKAVRQPDVVDISWTDPERDFYALYLQWLQRRAALVDLPAGFAMQMPLRLASACLPAAAAGVLRSARSGAEPNVEDADDPFDDGDREPSWLPPDEALVDAAHAVLAGTDSKLAKLADRLPQLLAGGRRGLLFTFSRPTLEYLRARLGPRCRVAVMHGGVRPAQRAVLLRDFRAGRYDLLLANRVASEGLDFEFCSFVVNYDLPWNPMEVEQRIGRIDRMGQRESKVHVVSLVNRETVDEQILERLLERIGVFEESIGELEPILQDFMKDIRTLAYDFTLTDEQRRRRLDEVVWAVEAESAERGRLRASSAGLLVTDDVDVAGMEDDLLRSGRYVGARELVNLVNDWASSHASRGIDVDEDGLTGRLRGTGSMAKDLHGLVRASRRTSAEVHQLIDDLNAEFEVQLALDPEHARVTGRPLLSATHPLTVAAVGRPPRAQARYSQVSIPRPGTDLPPGRYLCVLGVAEWTGTRPGREIWGAGTGGDGRPAPARLVDAVLARLAEGGLAPARLPESGDEELLVARSYEALRERAAREEQDLRAADRDRREMRRVSLGEQHARHMATLEQRLATATERKRHVKVVRMFQGQCRRAVARHQQLLKDLDEAPMPEVGLSPLAVLGVEVRP